MRGSAPLTLTGDAVSNSVTRSSQYSTGSVQSDIKNKLSFHLPPPKNRAIVHVTGFKSISINHQIWKFHLEKRRGFIIWNLKQFGGRLRGSFHNNRKEHPQLSVEMILLMRGGRSTCASSKCAVDAIVMMKMMMLRHGRQRHACRKWRHRWQLYRRRRTSKIKTVVLKFPRRDDLLENRYGFLFSILFTR